MQSRSTEASPEVVSIHAGLTDALADDGSSHPDSHATERQADSGVAPDSSKSADDLDQKETSISNMPPEISSLITQAISLIVYLTGIGKNPQAEVISNVLTAKRALDANVWSVAVVDNFLEAFSQNKLAPLQPKV